MNRRIFHSLSDLSKAGSKLSSRWRYLKMHMTKNLSLTFISIIVFICIMLFIVFIFIIVLLFIHYSIIVFITNIIVFIQYQTSSPLVIAIAPLSLLAIPFSKRREWNSEESTRKENINIYLQIMSKRSLDICLVEPLSLPPVIAACW